MPSVRELPVPGNLPRYEIPGWRTNFGVVAGITGRGSAEQPFDLGLSTEQPVGEVVNRWRALMAAEPGFRAHVLGRQVHGRGVRLQEGGEGWIQIEGVDGHVCTTPGVMLYVSAADCIPVYLVAPGKAVALVHAGWRGTAAGILERGVDTICQHSAAVRSEIVMHCGVGICSNCYEVGSEVFAGLGLPPGPHRDGHGQLDLRSVLADQGSLLGLTRISTSQWCSSHDRREFFSHRGSGGDPARMVAYLGIQP